LKDESFALDEEEISRLRKKFFESPFEFFDVQLG
jgi:hypothetical protein